MKNNSSRGAALVIVLFIATILGVVSVLLIAKTKQHIARITIAKQYMQADRVLLSDLNHLIFATQTSPYVIFGNNAFIPMPSFSGVEPLPSDINVHNTSFAFRSSQVKIQDMGGLISLIPLDRELFMRYLTSLNWPQEQIYRFLDVLEDWQDNDGFQRINGAESLAYSVFGYPLNQILQTVKDVALFANVSPLLLENLASDKHILQFGAGETSKENTPDDLLAVMNTDFDAQNIQAARDKSRQEGKTLPIAGYPSSNWIIHVESRYKQAKSIKEIHIVRRPGDHRPFVISAWQE